MRLSSPKAHCSSSTVFTPAIRRNKENEIVRSLKVVYHFYSWVFIFLNFPDPCSGLVYVKNRVETFSGLPRTVGTAYQLKVYFVKNQNWEIITFESRMANYSKRVMKFFEYIMNYKWNYTKIEKRGVKSDVFIGELTFEWSIFSDISGCESKYLGSRNVGGCFVLFSRVALTPPQPHPNDRWANWAPPITYSI